MSDTVDNQEQIAALDKEVRERLEQIAELRRAEGPEVISDYVLKGKDGSDVPLSSLFGDKQDLIVIHNMGRSCPYCTLWADGFNGVAQHLADRAAFVVVSPDAPEAQAAFAAGRGWRFPMLSNADSGFTEAMGYTTEHEGKTWATPGYSTFRRKDDGSIARIAHAPFGPGDPYCGTWHLFDLLEGGCGEWHPKFSYDA